MKTEQENPTRRAEPSPGGGWRRINQLGARIALPRLAGRPDSGALAIPDFRRYWLAMIVSNVGSWMQMVAQGWLILELTNSPFYLGLVGLVRSVPALSVTLIGGVLADRVDRRKMLLVTQVSAAILSLALGFLDLTGLVEVWHILAIAFLTATVMALDNPARQALVPDLVGKENIASAVGLNSAAWNAAAVVGPSLAGVLVAAISTAGAFILNGLSYFAVIYAVWKMQPRPRQVARQQTIFENLVAGLRYMTRDRRVWGLIAVVAVPTFLGRPYLHLMPAIARDVLHAGPTGYGVLMAASGLGALAGALTVGRLGRTGRKGTLLLLTTGLFGASLLLFAFTPWFAAALAVLLLVGATQTLLMALTNTLLQLTVSEEMRGRIMSIYVLIPMGFMPLGAMVLGAIGEVISMPLTVGVGAALVLLFTVIAWRAFPEVRRLP